MTIKISKVHTKTGSGVCRPEENILTSKILNQRIPTFFLVFI